MHDTELNDLVARATPLSTSAVDELPIGAEVTALRESIVGAAPLVSRRRRPQRWLVAAAAALLATAVVVTTNGGSGGSAYASEMVRIAEGSPRLLVTADGWEVTRADEFSAEVGELTLSDGTSEADLHWRTAAEHEGYVDDRAHSSDAPSDVEVLGQDGVLFRYSGTDDYTALWVDGAHSLELRMIAPSEDAFRAVLGSLERVSVDDWLDAMPPSVVKPGDRATAVAEMLQGLPLPTGFDQAVLDRIDSGVSDRYQLGARVAGAVACAWIDQWVAADATGNATAKAEAAEAIGTARTWPILLEMEEAGDYPEVIWEYADDINLRDGSGLYENEPMRDGGYREGLGCPS